MRRHPGRLIAVLVALFVVITILVAVLVRHRERERAERNLQQVLEDHALDLRLCEQNAEIELERRGQDFLRDVTACEDRIRKELALRAKERPAGGEPGWYCTTARLSKADPGARGSYCTRKKTDCASMRSELIRNTIVQGEFSYSACEPRSRAACFSFYDVVQQIQAYDCSVMLGQCEQMRALTSNTPDDFKSLSPCGSWD